MKRGNCWRLSIKKNECVLFGARFGGGIVGKGTGGFKRGLIGPGLQFLVSAVQYSTVVSGGPCLVVEGGGLGEL